MKLALFQPDIPQNTGTMIRMAACFGIDIEIIDPCGFIFSEKKLRRAAMDYMDHVKITRHPSWEDFMASKEIQSHRLILLSTKSNLSYSAFEYSEQDCLIVGRESSGVPSNVLETVAHSLTIPMRGDLRSLNVAIAASIVSSEAIRQIRKGYS